MIADQFEQRDETVIYWCKKYNDLADSYGKLNKIMLNNRVLITPEAVKQKKSIILKRPIP